MAEEITIKHPTSTPKRRENWPDEVPVNSRALQVLCFNKWIPRAQAVFWTGGSPTYFEKLVGERCVIRSRAASKNSARRLYNLWDCINHCDIQRASRYTRDWLRNH